MQILTIPGKISKLYANLCRLYYRFVITKVVEGFILFLNWNNYLIQQNVLWLIIQVILVILVTLVTLVILVTVVTQVIQVTLVTQVTKVTLVAKVILVTQVTQVTLVTLVIQVTQVTQVTQINVVTLVTISHSSYPSHPGHPSNTLLKVFIHQWHVATVYRYIMCRCSIYPMLLWLKVRGCSQFFCTEPRLLISVVPCV